METGRIIAGIGFSTVATIDWTAVGNLISNGLDMAVDMTYGFASVFDFRKKPALYFAETGRL